MCFLRYHFRGVPLSWYIKVNNKAFVDCVRFFSHKITTLAEFALSDILTGLNWVGRYRLGGIQWEQFASRLDTLSALALKRERLWKLINSAIFYYR